MFHKHTLYLTLTYIINNSIGLSAPRVPKLLLTLDIDEFSASEIERKCFFVVHYYSWFLKFSKGPSYIEMKWLMDAPPIYLSTYL